MKNKLEDLRKKIDKIDEKIIILLVKRMKIVKNVGKHKKEKNIQFFDKKRWQKLIKSKRLLAVKYNLSEKLIEEIWELIHNEALKIEKSI